jgi:hypothetical protein
MVAEQLAAIRYSQVETEESPRNRRMERKARR